MRREDPHTSNNRQDTRYNLLEHKTLQTTRQEMSKDDGGDEEEVPLVLQDLRRFLTRQEDPSSLFDKSATAVPVAAMKALLGVVQRTKAETMMGLQNELEQAAALMKEDQTSSSSSTASTGRSSNIALQSGCELFLKYITRTFLELRDFEECRLAILERGERFQMISLAARDRIATAGAPFVPRNGTVLTHGWSRVVAGILLEASKTKHFDLIILEGRPDAVGAKAAQFYSKEAKIPVRLVLDAAIGWVMEQADIVLVGADAVVENGGIVNKIGTNTLACCAKASGKPFYAAAESYKFARLYPLQQSDLPSHSNTPFAMCDTTTHSDNSSSSNQDASACATTIAPLQLDEAIQVENPPVDFTPSKFITLLFTDLGVLTPSAVSDELIRLYQ
jgi:translation initiation factor eIF-2B subunit alpha